jgi:soluble cytochrome b562
MEITLNNLLIALCSLIGGGGGLAVLQSMLNRKKNKVEITDQSIKTALDLEKLSKERYIEEVENNNKLQEKLRQAEKLLSEVRRELHNKEMELERYRLYIDVLINKLVEADLDVPLFK